ncbi:hypothetical protein AAKU55_005773 [Oxalobacteraceae bacterium GrIS 1.11]
MIKYTKIIFSLVLFLIVNVSSALDHEMYWFKNETTCFDAKIAIRSFCEVSFNKNATMQWNDVCSEQEIIIEKGSNKKISLNLLAHEPWHGEYHIATGLRCIGDGNKYYIYVDYDNGGSCDICEVNAVVDTNGKWKRYGRNWLGTSKQEKINILKKERNWIKTPQFFIPNSTLEK